MADDSERKNDVGSEARALLGDELLNPPSAAPPPLPAKLVFAPELPPAPLPELPLEIGPELPDLTRGAAWCLAASFVLCLLAGLGWWQPDWFTTKPSCYVAGSVLLAAAVVHLRGLLLLCRIDLVGGKRDQLDLSFTTSWITLAAGLILAIVYGIDPESDVLASLLLVTFLPGAIASWSLIFGLRRVGNYVGEPRVITRSFICQITLGIIFLSIFIQMSLRSGQGLLKIFLWFIPYMFVKELSRFSPTLQALMGISLLVYVHVLWLLWRACARVQRQVAIPEAEPNEGVLT